MKENNMDKEDLTMFNTNEWYACVKRIEEMWNKDYGTFKLTHISSDVKVLELTTGGWSENEEIINQLSDTFFWFLWWQESHRGGYYKFVYTGGIVDG